VPLEGDRHVRRGLRQRDPCRQGPPRMNHCRHAADCRDGASEYAFALHTRRTLDDAVKPVVGGLRTKSEGDQRGACSSPDFCVYGFWENSRAGGRGPMGLYAFQVSRHCTMATVI
jgi:hypothetical protein